MNVERKDIVLWEVALPSRGYEYNIYTYIVSDILVYTVVFFDWSILCLEGRGAERVKSSSGMRPPFQLMARFCTEKKVRKRVGTHSCPELFHRESITTDEIERGDNDGEEKNPSGTSTRIRSARRSAL